MLVSWRLRRRFGSLWFWVPVASVAGAWVLREGVELQTLEALVVAFAPVLIAALTTLWSRCEMRDALPSMGILAFAIPYFALPVISFYQLHRLDSWLAFLVLAIVSCSDAAAYFVGKAFGKHKLAPRVSPKKTWEGTLGGFAMAVLATAIWSQLRLGEIRPALLLLAAATAACGQVGDLVESMVKRGAGVKDSGTILPGHGGFYDRLDAMILAAPLFVGRLVVDRIRHRLALAAFLPTANPRFAKPSPLSSSITSTTPSTGNRVSGLHSTARCCAPQGPRRSARSSSKARQRLPTEAARVNIHEWLATTRSSCIITAARLSRVSSGPITG